jgi:hypothetical protein
MHPFYERPPHDRSAPRPQQDSVFAYGSLAADLAGGEASELRGFRRVWGVAMNNRVDVPGYKHYRLRADASRPAVFVAFLDLVADPRASTYGVCVPVTADGLLAIDRRERNYERVEVTDAVRATSGRVWAYVGTSAGRRRLSRARTGGRAVVSRDYLDRTRAAFAALGPAALEDFERTAALDGLEVWELDRCAS